MYFISLSTTLVALLPHVNGLLLENVPLSAHPKARCNDNSVATYYRQGTELGPKVLIYLQGGGFCVPRIPGFDCEQRCKDTPLLCTAHTDPFMETEDTKFSWNIWSRSAEENPAFYEHSLVFQPYCSSDVYTGNREGSIFTQGFTFNGKHIFTGLMEDLIANTDILNAEQVVLMGGSAGAMGTEANCDLLAERLHSERPDMDVRCISDSGTLYPFQDHTDFCYPQLLEYAAFEIWNAISDESCAEADPTGLSCISVGTAYNYSTTPAMLLMSSEDTVIRICTPGSEDTDFWQSWRDDLASIARKIVRAKPDTGLYIANCPFHVSSTNTDAWASMMVPLLGDQGEDGEGTIALKYLISNWVRGEGPYQALDDMNTRNPGCSTP